MNVMVRQAATNGHNNLTMSEMRTVDNGSD